MKKTKNQDAVEKISVMNEIFEGLISTPLTCREAYVL